MTSRLPAFPSSRLRYDVIIAGGGTMGTAAAWALGKRGLRILVLEQFAHVHDQGSHGGETRIIRHAYAESPEYVPLVLRADELWQELGNLTGEAVLVSSGGLELAAPGYMHARAARASADEHGIPYEWLTPADASGRWPQFTIPEDWDVLFAPGSGYLHVVPALQGMATAARQFGVVLRERSPVVAWGADPSHVWVDTADDQFEAASLIISGGAWSSRLLADLGLPITVQRKTLWWQQVDQPSDYSPDRFPVFITDSPSGEIYGFPIDGVPGLKIANHAGGEPVDPDTVDRSTRSGENRDCLELASLLLPAVRPETVKSAVCLYGRTPDTDFIVDRHPVWPQVALAAGFSGHGFKFAPAIGELLADFVTDPTVKAIPRLALSRFARVAPASGVSA
jgi:monomeric sarcosine oxidase